MSSRMMADEDDGGIVEIAPNGMTMPDQSSTSVTQQSRESTPSQQEQRTGIDIRKALDILSARTSAPEHTKENHVHMSGNTGETNAPTCCHNGGNEVPSTMKNMGQTIDVMAPTSSSAMSAKELEQLKVEQEKRQKEQEEKTKQHQLQLQSSLKQMTKTSEILQALLRAQEDRVKTYKQYDAALEGVLQTGNLTSYPLACATATASFAVLSDTIKAIRNELLNRMENVNTEDSMQLSHQQTLNCYKQYADWIQELQSLEQEKLQYTAAYHLERIRYRNKQIEIHQLEEQRENEQRILHLLQCSVNEFERRISVCVEKINAILEDLKCALIEEMEEEDYT